jgi:hypothetical protein
MTDISDFKDQVDAILADAIGFTSDDFADVAWTSFDLSDPQDAALTILESEGYPIDLLQTDSTGHIVL